MEFDLLSAPCLVSYLLFGITFGLIVVCNSGKNEKLLIFGVYEIMFSIYAYVDMTTYFEASYDHLLPYSSQLLKHSLAMGKSSGYYPMILIAVGCVYLANVIGSFIVMIKIRND